METAKKALGVLLKNFTIMHTVTSLSKEVNLSRVGIWKVLKKMQADSLVLILPVGNGKTSTRIVSINWDNPVVEKMLELLLAEEAARDRRWVSGFSELDGKVDFLIIYGSVLHSPKDANDIDILGVVSRNDNLVEIYKSVLKLQKVQAKKIHSINFTNAELKQELKNKNMAFIDAIKKGVVLFGHEKFIRFVREISKN